MTIQEYIEEVNKSVSFEAPTKVDFDLGVSIIESSIKSQITIDSESANRIQFSLMIFPRKVN